MRQAAGGAAAGASPIEMPGDWMSTLKCNARRKGALLGSASGAVLLAGMAVMTPQQARAACTVTSSGLFGVNQTMNCSNSGVNGGTFSAVATATVNVAPGTLVITPINASAGTKFNFNMNDDNSAVVGDGTMVNASSNTGQDWTINGTIQSLNGNAIVTTSNVLGSVDMDIGPRANVIAAQNAITINNNAVGGNVNVTNEGDIVAGNNALTINKGTGAGNTTVTNSGDILADNNGVTIDYVATSAGVVLVDNDGRIGHEDDSIGGKAVSVTGVLVAGTVKNSGSGSIHSAGDAVTVDVGGAAVVENIGQASITSTAGTA
jgi:hypothetical protein